MDKLLEKASKEPAGLNDGDLARVFVHLIEFPTENLICSDLESLLNQRAKSGSYEILRALSLYYSNLNGDLFRVGEGSDYEKAYLRALEFCDQALRARSETFNEKLDNYDEQENAFIERDFAFTLASLIEYASELKEALEYNIDEPEKSLLATAARLIASTEEVRTLENPRQILETVSPMMTEFVVFTRACIDALPEDD